MSVLFDWIAREGWIVFNWWLLATIAGYTALPMVMKLLPALPDQGYSLSRPAGMLLVTVVFWLLAVLGFVDNSPGSIVLAWILVLIISLTVFFSGDNRPDVKVWWTENRCCWVGQSSALIRTALVAQKSRWIWRL